MTTHFSLSPGAGMAIDSFADLDAYLGAVADAGFSDVSLGLQQVAFASGPGDLDRVAARVARHGLRCPDVLSLVVRRDGDATRAAADGIARLAAAVGAEHVLVLFFTSVRDESVELLSDVADIVGEAGARLAFEFTPKSPVSNIRDTLALVDRVGPERLGVMIDTWHFFRGDSTWEELASIPPERIAYVQFTDALPMVTEDIMHETTNRRTWPGAGELDLARFADTLRARGWSGLVSVEVLSEEHRRLDVSTYAALAHDTTAPYWS
jgi:sugar phosphate isomerase/epimerase